MHQDNDQLTNWLIEKSEILNDNYWSKIVQAEQDLAQTNDKKRKRNLQNIALQARNNIKKFKNQLQNLPTPNPNIKLKIHEYLNNWDSSFYYMAKFADTRNIEDFGTATNYYKNVDSNLQEILAMLGMGQAHQTQQTQQTTQPATQSHQVVREKEIIREKQVIIMIRCRYCKGAYNEELNRCPHCGGTR